MKDKPQDFGAASRTLARYGRPHRRWLLIGFAASIGIVAARLAIPWPLRWALEIAVSPETGIPGATGWAAVGDPVLRVMLLYLGIAAVLGVCEMIQRINVGRYAGLLVRDLRAAAVRGAESSGLRSRAHVGDLTAAVIGDSARIKSDLSGILVHATTNGLLFLAVCGVMLWMSGLLGLIFLVSGAVAIAIGLRTSQTVADTAFRQRRREGQYADAVHVRLLQGAQGIRRLGDLNRASASKDVRATRLISQSSLLAHLVLAAAVCLGVWVGAQQVRVGSMGQGELFLFIAYALTLHRRMVQVGRQTARTGKVVACANRLGALVGEPAVSATAAPAGARAESPVELRLEGATVPATSRERKNPRLHEADLVVKPGGRVAVVGPAGSGKSTLLRLLAGLEPEWEGVLCVDEKKIQPDEPALATCAAYLAQESVFTRQRVWKILGLAGRRELSAADKQMLRKLGVWNVIRSLPGKLDARVGSFELTQAEARALALGQILIARGASAWILDSPLDGISRQRALRRLDEIWARAGDRTVLISMARPISLDRFDGVVAMRNGQIVYDGPPSGWKRRKGV